MTSFPPHTTYHPSSFTPLNFFLPPFINRCLHYITTICNFPPAYFNETCFNSFCITADEDLRIETSCTLLKLMLCSLGDTQSDSVLLEIWCYTWYLPGHRKAPFSLHVQQRKRGSLPPSKSTNREAIIYITTKQCTYLTHQFPSPTQIFCLPKILKKESPSDLS